MQTRQLGNTGLRLTTIGLGTWAMGGGDWKFSWGPQDDAESIRTIHRALDLGINWIDTAAVYGLGHSEEVVGRALHAVRDRPLVATKCERCWDEAGRIIPRLKKESVRAEAEASLRRLGAEVLDLYQIHWPQPDEDIEEGWDAIADLIRAGKVRFGGVSNFSLRQLQRVQSIHPVTSLQPPYSMLAREVEAELLPYCAAQGIGVISYSPMQKGLLTGKVTASWVAALPADDHRRGDPKFQEPQLSANLGLAEALGKIAAESGKTLPQLAIAWVLRRPEVTAAIVGARRPDQIEQTIAGGDWQLAEPQITAIEHLLRTPS
ncbi:MAG: aldo/keto reductase [Pirellulaceae bacterium]|nr:aldo/keto reductase [Pirellulaceae bacterium]